MKKKAQPPTPPEDEAVDVPRDVSEPVADDDALERIIARPDGFHWVSPDGRQEFGPFETLEQAMADMHAPTGDDADGVDAETLQEAERDLGIADWIDPETGAPAEGQSPPHLEDE